MKKACKECGKIILSKFRTKYCSDECSDKRPPKTYDHDAWICKCDAGYVWPATKEFCPHCEQFREEAITEAYKRKETSGIMFG